MGRRPAPRRMRSQRVKRFRQPESRSGPLVDSPRCRAEPGPSSRSARMPIEGEGGLWKRPVPVSTRPEGADSRVRALHRTGPPGGRPRPRGSPHPQAQLHRHRAHPARPAPRGGGPRRPRARVARHHRGARPRPGGPHRRLRRGGHLRPDPVHPARQEGARARAARGALSLGHNYIGTEHILLGLVRENEGVAARILLDFDADSEKIRNEVIRMLSGPGGRQRGAGQGAARARARSPRSCSTSSAATSPSSPPRASSTPSSAARPRSSGSCRSSRAARRTTRC